MLILTNVNINIYISRIKQTFYFINQLVRHAQKYCISKQLITLSKRSLFYIGVYIYDVYYFYFVMCYEYMRSV